VFPILVPLIGLVALGWVLYGNIYPVPPAPIRYFPYITLTYFVVTMGFSAVYHRQQSGTADTVLVPVQIHLDPTALPQISQGAKADVVDLH
jgi:hypothetical protein